VPYSYPFHWTVDPTSLHKTQNPQKKKCTKLLLVLFHVQDYNDDANSFLSERPEMPANHDTGASGLPAAAAVAAGLGLNEILQQRPRSRSISPPNAEKTLDLTPKSRSRPGSPEASRHSPTQRRHSVAKSTESPTAVPLHFRRPPTSPGLSRAVPVEQPIPSPGSPSQQRNRRPGSVEFRNSREIRPLWLVERHSSVKGETEGEDHLPSLPSSKTSSRVPSIEDLKAVNDEDMKSWEHVDLSQSIMDNRPNLTISTDQANQHRDRDLDVLDSQQATPTAVHFDKEKDRPRYEFHSPSELLQDPASLDDLPASPKFDRLPSAEGSVVSSGSHRELSAEDKSEETSRALDALEGREQPPPRTPTQEHAFYFAKGGFANVVDAAAIAAVKEGDEHTLPADDDKERLGDIVDQAVAAESQGHKSEVLSEPAAVEEKGPEFESIKAPKELIPESAEQPAETQPQVVDVASDNVEATQSSKKKKKKKKEKKNQTQSESEPTQEDGAKQLDPVQDPVTETPAEFPEAAPSPGAESVEASRETQLEPEAVPVEGDILAQPEPEAEPVEASRDIALEPEAAPETSEAVIAPGTEAETVLAEVEQTEVTTSSSKKSKKDKKKKNRGKNASSEEPTEDVVSALPVEDNAASKEIDEVAISTDFDKASDQPAVSDVPAEQVPSEQLTQEELASASEEPIVPVDQEQPAEEASEPVFADANETQPPETPQPDTEEASRGLEDIEKPTGYTAVALDGPIAVPETPKEGSEGEDDFQEAVEEQSPQPAEMQLPQRVEEQLASDPAPEETPTQETPTEATESKAEKRKNKKKKNRKSATGETVAETPAAELEPQPEAEETTLEQSATADPADTRSPPISGEALPSDIEAVNNVDVPFETAVEEPVAPQEQIISSSEALDATIPTEVEHLEEFSRDLPAPAADTQPEADLVAPADDSSRQVTEPVVEPRPEAEAEDQPEVKIETEPKEPMTAAQKKKAKKDKKKKGKQSQSSVPDDEQPAESTEPAPEAEGTVEDTVKDIPALEDTPVDVPQESEQLMPTEIEQSAEPEQPSQPEQSSEEPEIPKEEPTLPAQPAAQLTAAEAPAEFSVLEEQPKAEEDPAEPEVAMTAAERKKAKKNKKKQQKQGESINSLSDDAQPVEPTSLLDTEPTETSKEIAPAEVAETVAPVDAAAPVDIELSVKQDVPAGSVDRSEVAPATENAAPAETELTESSKDVAPVSETEAPVVEETSTPVDGEVGTDAPAPVDLPQEIDAAPKPEEPIGDKETAASFQAKEPTVLAPEADATKEEVSTEPEVAMTAAEKKKAKKNKKKQQKTQSVQLDKQPTPEAEPTSTEEKSAEQPGESVPAAEATPAIEAAEEPVQPDVSRNIDVETKSTEEQALDVPVLDNEPSVELMTEEKPATPEAREPVLDVPNDIEGVLPVSEEVPALEESAQEEKKADTAVEEASLDRSLEEKPDDSVPESITEQGMTPAEKRKAKKDKKKNRQSFVAEEEQPAPIQVETKPLEEAIKPNEKESKIVPTEEPTESSTVQENEQPIPETNAEPPVVAEDVSKTEEAIDEENTKEPDPVDEAAAAAAAAEASEYAGMTAAQRKKAKKDKKKRQSIVAEQEQPTATEEEAKPVEEELKHASTEEPTQPSTVQENEQPIPEPDAEPAVAAEDVPKTEEAIDEENTKEPDPVDEAAAAAAAEASEYAGMTAAQRKKAKKDKKKRQSVAAEQEQPAPVEVEIQPLEEIKPVEEQLKHAPTEEATEPSTVQEVEQSIPEPDAEPAVAAEDVSKTEEAIPEAITKEPSPVDEAAAEAAEYEGITASQKKKAKKDKKKRESLAAAEQPAFGEEEAIATPLEPLADKQPAPAEEEVKPAPSEKQPTEEPLTAAEEVKDVLAEESTEPPYTQEIEQPSLDKDTEPLNMEEEPPMSEEPAVAEETTQPQASVDAAAAEAAEAAEYAGMTAAQRKKAKKEKKKRQSLAAEEQKPIVPEDEVKPAPIEEEQPEVTQTAQDVPTENTETIHSQEIEQPSPEQSVEAAATIEDASKTEEAPPAQKSSQPDEPADAAAEAAEFEGMTAAQKKKAKKDKKKQQRKSVAFEEDATPAEEPKTEQNLPAPEENLESHDGPTDLAASEESSKPVNEEAIEPVPEQNVSEQVEETAPGEESKEITEPETSAPTGVEEPITVAESTELPEQDTQLPSEPQSPAPQEPEVALTAAQKKKAKKNKKKGKSVDLAEESSASAEATQLPESATEKPTETPTEISGQPQPAEDVVQDVVESETPKPDEIETVPIFEDVLKDEAPATEAVAMPESTSKDADENASAPAEPAEEAGMSAKERRKAAKKAKKRQSKNVDADDESAPATEPGTPIEAADSVEKVLTSMATDAPGVSAVTAPSPAEHDGKDQSHDKTHDATAQVTASTDKFMSSQVETPTESSFLDYPPQPVLERSVNSGELEEVVAPQDGDVASSAQEPDVVEPTPFVEEKAVDEVEVGEERSSVPEAGDLSIEKVEESPVDVPVEVVEVQTEETPLEDEASEMAVSKKKNRKIKIKKQEEEAFEEEVQLPEPEASAVEEKEQLEVVPSIEANPPAKEAAIAQPEPIFEAEPVTVPGVQPEEQSRDIEEPSTTDQASADQPIEVAQETKEPSIPEAETIASPVEEFPFTADVPLTEEPKQAPPSKKKSKKDKKKERQLLAQELETNPRAEEQSTSKATEAPVPELEVATEIAYADEKPQDKLVAPVVEIQPVDLPQDIAKDVEPPFNEHEETFKEVEHPVEETEHLASSQEVETREPVLDVQANEYNTQEAEKLLEQAVEQPAEQASVDAPAEPEEELPIAPKKLSKKEKKKAAAAAAAALEEDKSIEPEAALIKSSATSPEATEEVPAQPIVDDPLPSETKDKPQPEAEKTLDEPTELTTAEPKEDVPEPLVEALVPIEPTEPEAQSEQSTRELAEEPADETVTQKMSKKEKKKAKKQSKQEPSEPSSPLPEVSVPTAEPEVVEAAPEPEVVIDESPVEIAAEPESMPQETPKEAFEPEPESIESPALEDQDMVIEDKHIPARENDDGLVSRGPIDVPSLAETEIRDMPADILEQAVTDKQLAPVEGDAAEPNVEKAAGSEVAGSNPAAGEPLEDQPQEHEVVPALSKKMSKKDKRKAKKNAGFTDEPSLQDQELPFNAVEQPAEVETQSKEPAMELETQHPELAAESETTEERELPIEAPLPAEDQATPEPEAVIESQQVEPQPVEESALFHKASTKKAKKALKANKSLDLEPIEKEISNAERVDIAPFEEDAPKARNIGTSFQKPAQDEEDWPAIDWEQKAEQSQQLKEADLEPEPVTTPEQEIIGEFKQSSFTEDLKETEGSKEVEDSWAEPLSKKDKKKAKNNQKQSQQAPEVEPQIVDKEIEPPARTTTPGGSKIANLFPGLERGGFKRALGNQESPKDSAEKETTADLEATGEFTIPVSEAPPAATETRDVTQEPELPSNLEEQIDSAIAHVKSYDEIPATDNESTRELEPELPTQGERSLEASVSFPMESTREEPTRQIPPEQAGEEQCGLRRSPSIHGRHQSTPRTWSLDEQSLPARAPSPPRSLFGGPSEDSYTRPRTPLDTIVEQEPRDGHSSTTAQRGTPRLEIKPEHVLPRPQTPVRKFTDNAFDRESWPTDESKKVTRETSRENFREITKTPDQGFQILKPSTSSGKLRRAKRSVSGDLRAASRDSQPSTSTDLDLLPSSSSYDPVTDKGKRPVRDMSDVYVSY
jgi:hypothetical protein